MTSPSRSHAASMQARVWLSTADLSTALAEQPPVAFTEDNMPEALSITVDETEMFQEVTGFGASFTDTAAWLIQTKLDPERRQQLMRQLLDADEGIGISFLRHPMGATDIVVDGLYSYDDVPPGETDFDLAHFSIDHDRAYLIPILQQARAINPALRIMASVWSPPAWMKSGDSMVGNVGGRLRPEAYPAYANYFVKFTQAFAAEQLPIYAITIQNEPQLAPRYPGMLMDADEQATFIKHHLGPAFAEHRLDTKILIYDQNWDHLEYPERILSDPEAARYVAGTAFHRYGGEPRAQSLLHEAHPDKEIYLTEGSTDVHISFGWMVQTLVIQVLRNWAKSVVLWNIAADEHNGPYLQPGGCVICRALLNIDTRTQTWRFNPDYYALGHVSKFVRPGARRIGSPVLPDSSFDTVAFKNTDGTIVLIVMSAAMVDRSFSVRWRGSSFRYTLAPGAVATFVWPGA